MCLSFKKKHKLKNKAFILFKVTTAAHKILRGCVCVCVCGGVLLWVRVGGIGWWWVCVCEMSGGMCVLAVVLYT